MTALPISAANVIPASGSVLLTISMHTPEEILKSHWGYTSFRPGQKEAISSILAGKDTLALLPTGGGKSICYQIPALLGEGMTLVISPLIALMKDQVDQLRARNIRAEAIHAGMSYTQIDRILDNAVYGGVQVLYVSPERLKSDLAEARIKQMPISLIAVDEAHCISQWGYDFRPAYLEIAQIREWIPDPPVLALTATAIPEVVRDIQEKLLFPRSNIIQTSFRRENLSFFVEDRPDKEQAMCNWLTAHDGTGIVYVRSRKRTLDYAVFLQERGISAAAFHAGLDTATRFSLQEQWQHGAFRVMVATNAFGMGIDKANVRIVIHADLPDSLEAYYQEAGRAGRDGLPAHAVLLAGVRDLEKLNRQFQDQFPPLQEIRQVYRALGSYYQLAYGSGELASFDFDLIDFSSRYSLVPIRTLSALRILEESGWLSLTESVFHPATLWLKSAPQDLYQYQLKNKKIDTLIKTVQRLYQGLYQYPVAIQISQIMVATGMSEKSILQLITFLNQSGIIDFRPMKDKPQLTFLLARQDPDHLVFDLELLDFRKQRQADRLEAIASYLDSGQCRQQMILHYFGESSEEECGLCDHCLSSQGKTVDRPADEQVESMLATLFAQQEEWPPGEILRKFHSEQHLQVKRILQHWCDEGQVRENYGKLIKDR
ncbi:MAG: RecQ family ATP-dependent DNA helicase [Saprospiraceae bacterium]|nr:RecQ family ATP-dependent DNA helicase [Saprospiraceae bacterium]